MTNRKETHRRGKVQLVDARRFFVKMRKSLGNKRNLIDDDQIADIAGIYGDCRHDDTRTLDVDGEPKDLVVSKVFDNDDFGYHKITVERPLKLNFALTPERMARLEDEKAFQNLARSKKKDPAVNAREQEAGRERQQLLRQLLQDLAADPGDAFDHNAVCRDRKAFLDALKAAAKAHQLKLTAAERKAILSAVAERDDTAAVCTDRKGNPEPDTDLRDTEIVPLKDDIQDYVQREVLPHVPGAWIDESKTRIGYEIPLNRHFYRYEPPRPLEEIEADIKQLEGEIVSLLKDVTS